VIILQLVEFPLFSQVNEKQLIKIGSYYNFVYPSTTLFNFEAEKSFAKRKALTHGFRMDYYSAPPSYSGNKVFRGARNLMVSYGLKWYPLHFVSRKPYHCIFIGAELCYITAINKHYKFGPGLGSQLGYQYVFKNNISLGPELKVIYMQNVNDLAFRNNPHDRYFYIIPSIKIGKKLRPKNTSE
jgi:hypothetical protein